MPKMTSWTRRGFIGAILGSLSAKMAPKKSVQSLPYKQTGSFYTYRYKYITSSGDTVMTFTSSAANIAPGQVLTVRLPDMPYGVVEQKLYRA